MTCVYTGLYRPLIDLLVQTDGNELILTFAEIERLIGRPLADTSYVDQSTWRTYTNGHVRAWRALGWEAQLDRAGGCVVWGRVMA